jgi:hypothetical protein
MMQPGQKTTLTEANDVFSFSVSLACAYIYLDHRRISRVVPSVWIPRLCAGHEQHWVHSRYRSWFVTIIPSSALLSPERIVHIQVFLTKETSCPRRHSTSMMLGMSSFLYFSFRALTAQNAEMAVKSRHSSLRSCVSTSRRIIKSLRFYEVPSKPLRSGRRTSLGLPSTRLGTSSGTRALDVTRSSMLD